MNEQFQKMHPTDLVIIDVLILKEFLSLLEFLRHRVAVLFLRRAPSTELAGSARPSCGQLTPAARPQERHMRTHVLSPDTAWGCFDTSQETHKIFCTNYIYIIKGEDMVKY